MMRSRPVRRRPARRDRRGFALITAILITIVAAAVALGAAMLTMNTTLSQKASDRSAALDDAALAGIEEARNRLNARLDTMPMTAYRTVENGVTVPGSDGIQRWTYVGRRGNTNNLANAGEFGVMGHIISHAKDSRGNQTIRRSEIYQESFARYADFTDKSRRWDGVTLWWALGMQAAGPVHSNDTIRVWSGAPFPQATFHDEVTTQRIVLNKTNAQYMKGPPKERVARIPLPSTADLDILKNIAAGAGYSFTPSYTVGDSANATMRIEFLAIDVNNDGDVTDPDEGFFRIYQQYNDTRGAGYARGSTPAPPPALPLTTVNIGFGNSLAHAGSVPANASNDSLMYSWNCGPTYLAPVYGVNREVTVDDSTLARRAVRTRGPGDTTYTQRMRDKRTAWGHASTRCFLGGDERLNGGVFRSDDLAGRWIARTAGSIPPALAGRADAAFLWPLSPSFNSAFRGVIFVEGQVAVSGVVRGRVTLAARNTISIVHSLTQSQNPGVTSGCTPDGDIVGLFSGQYVFTADNTLISPQQRRTDDGTGWQNWTGANAVASSQRKDFDPDSRRPDLAVHAVTMGLNSVAAERPNPPGGLPAARYVNRGTMRGVGGQIQDRAGQTGTMSGAQLHGINTDISFNTCAKQYPPPYFPTTGRWSLTQFFEVNPTGFDPTVWFNRP
ncbi:MAG: hypothetical protein MUF00_04515 [Gemmatimonadaceae bacterium]|jgi:hypothetical protein|nr:hypothetical protein [Gemmatimonadaceae bacterium]